jgi:hypothetical protein
MFLHKGEFKNMSEYVPLVTYVCSVILVRCACLRAQRTLASWNSEREESI